MRLGTSNHPENSDSKMLQEKDAYKVGLKNAFSFLDQNANEFSIPGPEGENPGGRFFSGGNRDDPLEAKMNDCLIVLSGFEDLPDFEYKEHLQRWILAEDDVSSLK
jgi:hypothetical protein